MSDPSIPIRVLIVADPPRLSALASALAAGSPRGPVRVLEGAGDDDTIELFEAERPAVIVVTASLVTGDSRSLIGVLRGLAGSSPVGVVVIGDVDGPHRTARDVAELAPDQFVESPVSDDALREAVDAAVDAVERARGGRTVSGEIETNGTPAFASARRGASDDDGDGDDDGDDGDGNDPTLTGADAEARATQRARWEALADAYEEEDVLGSSTGAPHSSRRRGSSAVEVGDDDILEIDPAEEAEPLPPISTATGHDDPAIDAEPTIDAPPVDVPSWAPGSTSEFEPPAREPTLILSEPAASGPLATAPPPSSSPSSPSRPPPPRSTQPRVSSPLAALESAIPLADLFSESGRTARSRDVSDEIDDDLGDLGLDDLETFDRTPREPSNDLSSELRPDARPPERLSRPSLPGNRDFARQLRAKMSKMAQRLFQGADSEPAAVDLRPRHDHHTEIDLTSLGEDVSLDRGATEIEAQAAAARTVEPREPTTSPGSWDTAIRERGLPDNGELVRGLSDAAMLLARMFAQAATGRLIFRDGEVEKIVYCDQGRPVFAASSQRRDRMGELLVREGKITLTQYERCQAMVAESGRRMGEILVDLGYLKRRELLPAVRRHVEDIVYSLFGWDHGTYHIMVDSAPSSERIRMSRHPASLILEGIRRKLDRTSLERLIGPPSTVLEVPDRERLGGIINLSDLSAEERAALAAFDGQADLATVARAAGVDVADLLPVAWGLCALGLATARRTDTEVPDESSALFGETDLAIDRERVRARWDLVAEADYFALLGVRRDATTFEIRRAYQAARRDFAADVFPPDLRRELAQELDDISHVLDEAFRVLRDDRLRLTYLTNLVG